MGEQGDDALYGGDGDDWLWGGKGKNQLDGGTGVDFLFYQVGSDSHINGEQESASFGADFVRSQWTATQPNTSYRVHAPVVAPTIVPKGESNPLYAPAGSNFIGILNPEDQDISGKLVHAAVAGPFPSGTVFHVTVFANRGRLAGAKTALFEASPSEVRVQFFGWGPGSLPTINSTTDDWSRHASVRSRQAFTHWAANGQWFAQTFQFVTDRALSYVSLSLAGVNHRNSSYVAFDIKE
jgi:Ca2+-binding RTX toxin-like protein